MIKTKAALITGAGNPFGRAAALRLAQDGFALALCDETEEKLQNIPVELRESAACRIYVVSESDEAVVREFFTRLEGEFDHMDVLVNARINNPVKSFVETNSDDIRSAFGSGVIPAMLFTQSVSDWMIRKGIKGHIVNISSDRAFQASDDSFIESVTSWALRGTTRAMAKHLAKKDIKVNACCVGDASPEEAAEMVAFLAEDTNANITGQNMMVNHGRVMD